MKELTANEAAGIRIKTKPKISTGLCAFAIVMILSGNAALMIPGLIFALAVLIAVFSIQDETCARIGAEEIVLLPEKSASGDSNSILRGGRVEYPGWNPNSNPERRNLFY